MTSPQRGHSGRSRPPSPSPGSTKSHVEHGHHNPELAGRDSRGELSRAFRAEEDGALIIILIASWTSRRFSPDGFSAHSLSSAGVGAAFGTPRAARGRVGLTSAGVIFIRLRYRMIGPVAVWAS